MVYMVSMASKFNKVTNKDICLQALLGLFVGAIFSSCFHGFHPNVEELNRSHFTQSLGEFYVFFHLKTLLTLLQAYVLCFINKIKWRDGQ